MEQSAGSLAPASAAERSAFLMKMYDQMLNDINRHILVVWQSVGVVVGALALFALAEKNVMPIDLAIAFIILLAAWLVAHLSDASYWYNRNLVIIANIERQFLLQSDLRDIHPYWGEHRPKNRMISHFQIQLALALGLIMIVVLFHLTTRVYPGLTSAHSQFEPVRTLPYVVLCISVWYCLRRFDQDRKSYKKFLETSPGRHVAKDGITYGPGHGFREGEEG